MVKETHCFCFYVRLEIHQNQQQAESLFSLHRLTWTGLILNNHYWPRISSSVFFLIYDMIHDICNIWLPTLGTKT